MDRAGSATDRSRMSYRQQECPGPATGRAMRKGHDAAKSGREEVSRQVLGHGSVEEGNGEEHEEEEEEEKEEEEKEEESDYKDPSSSWGRRHSHGAPLGSSSSIKPLAPHKAIYDPAVYRPLLAASAASSSTNGASERASTPRAPASTASVAKRERTAKKAPSYMPLWRCDTCDDEVSVFLRDEHCRTKTHLPLARRAGAGGGGEPSAASGSGGGGGGGSVYDEAPESSAGYVGLLPAYTPVPGYKLRDTFYCPLCASEFPLSTEALHDEGSGVYMCVCCARRVHTAGEAVHAKGDVHQQMARVQLAGDDEGERYEEEEKTQEAPESEGMASKGRQEARVEPERGGRDGGFEVLQSRAAAFHRVEAAVQERRKKKQERVMARAEGWQEGRGAKSNGKPVWKCNVCKETLLVEEMTSHRMGHCRGAASSVVAAAAETAAETAAATAAGTAAETAEAAGNQPQALSLTPMQRAPQPAVWRVRPNIPRRPPTPVVSYETFFCEPCNKHVAVCIRHIHIASRRHIKLALPPAAPAAPALHPRPHPQHLPLLISTPLPPPPPRRAPQPAPPTPAAPEKAYCPECQKWKLASGMAAHRMSNRHMKKVEALAEAQKAGRACTGGVSKTEAPVSVGTGAHAERWLPTEVPREVLGDRWVTINGPRIYCEVCERSRDARGLAGHIGSASHRKNARLREEGEKEGAVV